MMSKNNSTIVVGIVLVSIVLLLFVLGIIKLPAKKTPTATVPAPTADQSIDPIAPNPGNNSGIPIASTDPSVSLLLLSYSLVSNIDTISVSGNTGALTLINADNKKLPEMPLTAQTKVITITTDGKQESATLATLKENMKVNVQAQYNVSSRKWSVNFVNILPQATTKTGTTQASPTKAPSPSTAR